MSMEERAAFPIWQLMRRSPPSVKESLAHSGSGEPISWVVDPSSMTIQSRESSGKG